MLQAIADVLIDTRRLGWRDGNFTSNRLEIEEHLGDIRGKSTTLHHMAYVQRIRGDLDGAMAALPAIPGN